MSASKIPTTRALYSDGALAELVDATAGVALPALDDVRDMAVDDAGAGDMVQVPQEGSGDADKHRECPARRLEGGAFTAAVRRWRHEMSPRRGV